MKNIYDKRICIKEGCTFCVVDKINRWKVDPWKKYYSKEQEKTEILKPILNRLVHDPLHTYTNIMLNMLSSCYYWLKNISCSVLAASLAHRIGRLAPSWPKATFQANTAKLIMEKHCLAGFCKIGDDVFVDEELNSTLYVNTKHGKTKEKTVLRILQHLVDSLEFCFEWLHCSVLNDKVYSKWKRTRKNILTLCSLFSSHLNPTVHYWCDHSWSDAFIYGPPSMLKQELGEAINKWHKRYKKTCCKGRFVDSDYQNSWECLLHHLFALGSLADVLNYELSI